MGLNMSVCWAKGCPALVLPAGSKFRHGIVFKFPYFRFKLKTKIKERPRKKEIKTELKMYARAYVCVCASVSMYRGTACL